MLIADVNAVRGLWVIARIVNINPDQRGVVRSVKLQTRTNLIERPVTKIVLLVPATELRRTLS